MAVLGTPSVSLYAADGRYMALQMLVIHSPPAELKSIDNRPYQNIIMIDIINQLSTDITTGMMLVCSGSYSNGSRISFARY